MAEAVVTFFLEKLSTLITEEANLLLGVDEQVRQLQNELEWISLFVKRADLMRRSNQNVKLWVRQLREITFHAEDVIDEFILKIDKHRHERRNLGRFVRSLKSCITCTQQLPLLHELRNQINVINTMTEKISANQAKYCIGHIEFDSNYSSSNNEVSWLLQQKVKRVPITEESNVAMGVEDDAEQVKSLLMGGGYDKQQLVVVSIVGMAGLGKSALAKKVYNSTDVKLHFNCFAWVSISQEYTPTELLQGIIKLVTMQYTWEELEKLDEGELRKTLCEYLQGDRRKYLIVLDGIWDTQAWDDLNAGFPDEKNGSRILLTTRNTDVAVHASASFNNIHKLPFLNRDESWKLFIKKIFQLEGASTSTSKKIKKIFQLEGASTSTSQEGYMCPQELETLGNLILTNYCVGLPLAILVLGGLLSMKEKTKKAWVEVYDRINWHLTHGSSSHPTSVIFAVSYYDLPNYLKPCFMYMGLFPEDHEISASKLVQYWIAEGLVQSRGEETMEDVAEKYLEELIHRSMIQVGKWRSNGGVRTCRIPNALRNLSISESKEVEFFHVYGNIGDFSESNSVRRLTVHGGRQDGFNEEQYFSQLRYTRHVRSLMCFRVTVKHKTILEIFMRRLQIA